MGRSDSGQPTIHIDICHQWIEMRSEWLGINSLVTCPHSQADYCGNATPEIRDDKLPNLALRNLWVRACSTWCPEFADGAPAPVCLLRLKDCRNKARLHLRHNRTCRAVDDKDAMERGNPYLLGCSP